MSSKTVDSLTGKPSTAIARRSWSLAVRLTVWYTLSAFILVATATGFLYWSVSSHLEADTERLLIEKSEIVLGILSKVPTSLPKLKDEIETEPQDQKLNRMFSRVADGNGRILAETAGMHKELPPEMFPLAQNAMLTKATLIRSKTGRPFQVITTQTTSTLAPKENILVQVGFDRSSEEELLEDYREGIVWVLAVTILLSSLIGYGIAQRGMRPVKNIVSTVARIGSTTLNERIDSEHFPQELSTLASTFNEMLDRLEESFARLSQFSADIAHELRTPLNNLRGEAEVGLSKARTPKEYEEILGSCLEECARLSGMIDSLFFLARAEDPQAQIKREVIDVRRELNKVCEFYEPDAQVADTNLEIQVDEGLTFELDRSLFQRAAANLLTNALRHTKKGAIIISATLVNSSLVIEIVDTGSGIPKEHLPYIFDRFYRADPSRATSTGNMGLGLSIVKSIIALHKGSLQIDSDLGHGTKVTMIYPKITES